MRQISNFKFQIKYLKQTSGIKFQVSSIKYQVSRYPPGEVHLSWMLFFPYAIGNT